MKIVDGEMALKRFTEILDEHLQDAIAEFYIEFEDGISNGGVVHCINSVRDQFIFEFNFDEKDWQ